METFIVHEPTIHALSGAVRADVAAAAPLHHRPLPQEGPLAALSGALDRAVDATNERTRLLGAELGRVADATELAARAARSVDHSLSARLREVVP
ncbi:hypothetical protein [Corynebacterium liangguodongii]|uniref:Uncharacterized protein n=1 Tax=Corynebacterium liangguodongii TaxID=2079535 RepID=A0A2S0WCL0_9CORY|nr:hypothetical protein [Corynebacterium liangguodongii]AWB83490.1 hypothetical protein C3E79_02450 [Corynebacterium liangguodongii]PWC00421.1 hypothetical protein DF219_00505 [Corynebacterium liangguodongii]